MSPLLTRSITRCPSGRRDWWCNTSTPDRRDTSMKSVRERMDIQSAHKEAGTLRVGHPQSIAPAAGAVASDISRSRRAGPFAPWLLLLGGFIIRVGWRLAWSSYGRPPRGVPESGCSGPSCSPAPSPPHSCFLRSRLREARALAAGPRDTRSSSIARLRDSRYLLSSQSSC